MSTKHCKHPLWLRNGARKLSLTHGGNRKRRMRIERKLKSNEFFGAFFAAIASRVLDFAIFTFGGETKSVNEHVKLGEPSPMPFYYLNDGTEETWAKFP